MGVNEEGCRAIPGEYWTVWPRLVEWKSQYGGRDAASLFASAPVVWVHAYTSRCEGVSETRRARPANSTEATFSGEGHPRVATKGCARTCPKKQDGWWLHRYSNCPGSTMPRRSINQGSDKDDVIIPKRTVVQRLVAG